MTRPDIHQEAKTRYLKSMGLYECICGNVWKKGQPCLYRACPVEQEKQYLKGGAKP